MKEYLWNTSHLFSYFSSHKISLLRSTVISNRSPYLDYSSEQSFEQIESVPLTDDVLRQCGFIYHDYFKFWQHITTGIRSEMDINSDYDVIDFMRRPIIKKMTSLHQLQNVYFMLKGRELKLYDTTIASR